jgi:hypothetical protein
VGEEAKWSGCLLLLTPCRDKALAHVGQRWKLWVPANGDRRGQNHTGCSV